MIKKYYFFPGVIILIVILISYFTRIKVNSDINSITYDKLLGIVIFHNPFILLIYIVIAIILIVKSIKK